MRAKVSCTVLKTSTPGDRRAEFNPAGFTDAPFQVDHIIAEKHHGPTTAENLAWSCFYCNSFKGPNIAGWSEEEQAVVRLFHPRRDEWYEHFVWDGPHLQGLTSIGRVTIDVLCINDPEAVEFRRLLLELGIPLR
jgi:hypothetical protein